MKFKTCNKYDGLCPCLRCENTACHGCFAHRRKDGVGIDTDRLCPTAKAYCESGRDDQL